MLFVSRLLKFVLLFCIFVIFYPQISIILFSFIYLFIYFLFYFLFIFFGGGWGVCLVVCL